MDGVSVSQWKYLVGKLEHLSDICDREGVLSTHAIRNNCTVKVLKRYIQKETLQIDTRVLFAILQGLLGSCIAGAL